VELSSSVVSILKREKAQTWHTIIYIVKSKPFKIQDWSPLKVFQCSVSYFTWRIQKAIQDVISSSSSWCSFEVWGSKFFLVSRWTGKTYTTGTYWLYKVVSLYSSCIILGEEWCKGKHERTNDGRTHAPSKSKRRFNFEDDASLPKVITLKSQMWQELICVKSKESFTPDKRTCTQSTGFMWLLDFCLLMLDVLNF